MAGHADMFVPLLRGTCADKVFDRLVLSADSGLSQHVTGEFEERREALKKKSHWSGDDEVKASSLCGTA